MKWIMLVERWPGVSSVEDAPSGDRLKTIASDIWKGARNSEVSKARFIIYDPVGVPWQTCIRVTGGSWRAHWERCTHGNTRAPLKGDTQ